MVKQYVLVDYENVQPETHEVSALWSLDSLHLKIFIGCNSKSLPCALINEIQRLGERANYVDLTSTGKNATDFQICYMLGQLTVQEGDSTFYIISKDKGFDPLIKSLQDQGVKVNRREKIENIPEVKRLLTNFEISKELEGCYQEVPVLLKEQEILQRPKNRDSLKNWLQARLSKTRLPDDEAERLIQLLIKRKQVKIEGKAVKYLFEDGDCVTCRN